MLSAASAAFFLLAQSASAAVQGPPAPRPQQPATVDAAAEACAATPETTREIVVCAQRPNGYRLNPDLLQAKREMHSAGRPKRPPGTTVMPEAAPGPPPAKGLGGVDVIAVAATALTIAQRLAKGEEVGSIFVTDPHPTEYQLYLMAKARREARELEEKETRAAARAKAAAAAAQPEPGHP